MERTLISRSCERQMLHGKGLRAMGEGRATSSSRALSCPRFHSIINLTPEPWCLLTSEGILPKWHWPYSWISQLPTINLFDLLRLLPPKLLGTLSTEVFLFKRFRITVWRRESQRDLPGNRLLLKNLALIVQMKQLKL